MKKCTVCYVEKELDNYSKDSYRKDGYDATCKECKKKQSKERGMTKHVIPSSKSCSSCSQVLTSDNFHKKPDSLDGLHTECRSCKKIKRLEKKEQNLKSDIMLKSPYYNKICNICNISKSHKDFYIQNYSKDGIGTICINCEKIRQKEWRIKNPNKAREYRSREYFKDYHNRRILNAQSKISGNIRNRVRMALKRQNTSKFQNTFELIDCSPLFMTNWLENQFSSDMTWNNYGSYWEIDHIVPCNFFDLSKREEQLACFNWRNCRPCKKSENRSKSDKIQSLQIFLQEIRVHYYERHIQIAGKP